MKYKVGDILKGDKEVHNAMTLTLDEGNRYRVLVVVEKGIDWKREEVSGYIVRPTLAPVDQALYPYVWDERHFTLDYREED